MADYIPTLKGWGLVSKNDNASCYLFYFIRLASLCLRVLFEPFVLFRKLKMTVYRRKLIEVDLPLDDINRESAREKSIRHGHPSTLHLWWARRPLAACRAVIFASMVDDPSSCPDEFPGRSAR